MDAPRDLYVCMNTLFWSNGLNKCVEMMNVESAYYIRINVQIPFDYLHIKW